MKKYLLFNVIILEKLGIGNESLTEICIMELNKLSLRKEVKK